MLRDLLTQELADINQTVYGGQKPPSPALFHAARKTALEVSIHELRI